MHNRRPETACFVKTRRCTTIALHRNDSEANNAMTDLEKNLYSDIAQLLEQARKHVQRAANSAMVYTYYEIGRRIVEEEQ